MKISHNRLPLLLDIFQSPIQLLIFPIKGSFKRSLLDFFLRKMFTFQLFVLLFITSCSSENQNLTQKSLHEICCRDRSHTPIYQVQAPNSWKVIHPSLEESLSDTTKFLSEFLISKGEETIRITIHNFPTKTEEERIPANAQIQRWKRQFDQIDPESLTITPQSFSGYAGAVFEATGKLKGKKQTMMAWAMLIAPQHYRALSFQSEDKEILNEQKRADFTIKALGPVEMMEIHRSSIIKFARSFELIDEIGYP